MKRNTVILFAAAVAGLLGIGLWLSRPLLLGVLFALGVCLLLVALFLLEKKKAHTAKRRGSRHVHHNRLSSRGQVVEAEGWALGPELDEVTTRTLHAAELTVQRMRRIAASLDDDIVVRKINDICDTSEAIVARIVRNPERLPGVRRFFDYHLPATGSILNKYMALLQSEVYTNDMEYQVKQIEELLDRIRRHFKKHLHRLVQDDLLDVEIEVNAFERVMRSEGL